MQHPEPCGPTIASGPRPVCDGTMSAGGFGDLITRTRAVMWELCTQRTQAELGITTSQASILLSIANGTGSTSADLAREQGIDASAVTRLVDKLADLGLIERHRSSADRRVVHLSLTAQGERIAIQVPRIFTDMLNQILTDFTPNEVALLKRMLGRILTNAGHPVAASLQRTLAGS
ncbi:MarR family winged helix-turn-helix transcriptional regulator [Paraburkholderia sp.]|uniref:MarR family winged helix-turn-helix transcriptional regulator n=1 Tax=Paraburkholderia sp. TaxID=1926495 RepID=UPI002390EFF0|nr:MarR family winged helix-turn-helix transcriptional regulator [Paraburkholderia sp.]MDE1179277.1 MarR family winged helix-turn-helix transcriptional regulator [Paraburkholderia sp.]